MSINAGARSWKPRTGECEARSGGGAPGPAQSAAGCSPPWAPPSRGSSPPTTPCSPGPRAFQPRLPSAALLRLLAWCPGFSRAAPRPQSGSLSLSLGRPHPSSRGLCAAWAHPPGLPFLISSKRAPCAEPHHYPASLSFPLRLPSALWGPRTSPPRLSPPCFPPPSPPQEWACRDPQASVLPLPTSCGAFPSPTTSPQPPTHHGHCQGLPRAGSLGTASPVWGPLALRVTAGALPSPHPTTGSRAAPPKPRAPAVWPGPGTGRAAGRSRDE